MRILLLALSLILVTTRFINADLVNTKVDRTIELTSNVAHITNLITVENKATTGVKSYTFVVEPEHVKNVAFVGAKLSGGSDDDNKNQLKVTELPQDANKRGLYKIDFKEELAAGKAVGIEVEVVLHDSMRPYPTEISQQEKQLVVFTGNHYFYSQYQTQKQTTVVNLASEKVESYSQLKPTTKTDSAITYGPYDNIKPLQQDELSVHFENNAAFINIETLKRTIEVSLWGNIAVEETIDMVHAGAKLKGSFSRFDYMRRVGGNAAVKSFKTLLPPSAADVYYRDEIGNISTSNLRVPGKSKKGEPVELELRPRFPLFGGWRTHYTVGYNVPVYQYLYNKGSDFVLKMKLIDHVIDDQYIESAEIRIILPERATNIEFAAPYSVQQGKNELHFTYLDTVGRPVVVVNKKHAVENHIKDFQIKFNYNKSHIYLKPLLLVGVFFLIFFVVIVAVRIDFSISTKSSEHAKKE